MGDSTCKVTIDGKGISDFLFFSIFVCKSRRWHNLCFTFATDTFNNFIQKQLQSSQVQPSSREKIEKLTEKNLSRSNCCINIYEYNMLVMAQGSYHTTVRLAYFIVSTGSESVPTRDYQIVWWGPWSLKRLTEFGVGCSLYCEREDKLALESISNHCWLNCIVDSVKGGSLSLVRVYYMLPSFIYFDLMINSRGCRQNCICTE